MAERQEPADEELSLKISYVGIARFSGVRSHAPSGTPWWNSLKLVFCECHAPVSADHRNARRRITSSPHSRTTSGRAATLFPPSFEQKSLRKKSYESVRVNFAFASCEVLHEERAGAG
jgi:hypothetical protein